MSALSPVKECSLQFQEIAEVQILMNKYTPLVLYKRARKWVILLLDLMGYGILNYRSFLPKD